MSNSEFTDLLKPHYNDALNYCRALCSGNSKAEAEDVLQQSLLKAFEHFDSLKDKQKFKSWFFQIITRNFYNSVRKPFWSKFSSLFNDDDEVQYEAFEDNFFDDNQLLMASLTHISKKERVAILLFEIGGFSIQEITIMQNEKSESTIKSRLSRTRNKLREIMAVLESEFKENKATIKLKKKNSNTTLGSSKSSNLYHETEKVIKEIKSIG